MGYSVDDNRFIFKDGNDLLSDMFDYVLHMQFRVNSEGKTFDILESFYDTLVNIIGHADFESVISNGTVVDLLIPTDPSFIYRVKKYDKLNRRYFITCKPKGLYGKSFGFWIDSDFVKSK